MKKLYYATFEKGFDEVVKQIIKKQDKNAQIKKLYEDAVLFFADEHFIVKNMCLSSAFVVIHNTIKTGVGALNVAIKDILSKKSLKIGFGKNTEVFKLSIMKENENVVVDNKLKLAFEIMLKKITKMSISYFSDNELVLLAKKDGETLFMRKLDTGAEFKKVTTKFDLLPQVAYVMSYLSNPSPDEVVLDPFAGKGIIAYVRALSFKKANVIANEVDKEKIKNLKTLAKSLKDKSLSILNYQFLDSEFPIKFIDKIVTDLSNVGFGQVESYYDFFEKAFKLGVKTIVVAIARNYSINRFIEEKYEVEKEINSAKLNVYKLKLRA